MPIDWDAVTHVTKVDPAKSLPSELAVLEGTDLVVVGGSDGVTEANVLESVRAIRDVFPEMSVCQEPSSAAHVSAETIQATDALAVPAVYNGDHDHFVGTHVTLFAELARRHPESADSSLPGDAPSLRAAVTDPASRVVGEGYVVQHLESAVADRAGVTRRYSRAEVAGAALATETFYRFPIFYVEYSGSYGGPEDVAAAASHLEETTLLYGGGIDSAEKATEILDAGADAVVVGDCFHDDPAAFRETIPG